MRSYMKTPEQAAEYVCPMSMMAVTVNSEGRIAHCQGEKCMAWRWKYAGSGYYEKDSPKIPNGWVLDQEDHDVWTTSDGRDKYCYRDPNDPVEGYCGLVAG